MSSEPPPQAEPSSGAAPEGPSKSALKKAEAKAKKEAEKARKAAEREKEQQAQAAQAAEDLGKDNYGSLPKEFVKSCASVRLEKLTPEHVGKAITIRGILRNSRMQGAKMAFIELVKGGESIQGMIFSTYRLYQTNYT